MTLQATCSHCRFWAPHLTAKPEAAFTVGAVFACRCAKVNQPSFEIAEMPSAAGADEGGHFLTGPEYGCVHWEDYRTAPHLTE